MNEAVRFAKRYTPGSNAWYARLALERLFWDRLQAAGDPKAHQSFRRIQRRARQERNQSFWWQPGQPTPSRAPDVREGGRGVNAERLGLLGTYVI